jgi:hypothetical protein
VNSTCLTDVQTLTVTSDTSSLTLSPPRHTLFKQSLLVPELQRPVLEAAFKGRKLLRRLLDVAEPIDLKLEGEGVKAGDKNLGVDVQAYGQGTFDGTNSELLVRAGIDSCTIQCVLLCIYIAPH